MKRFKDLIWAAVAAVALTGIGYGPTLRAPLAWDDEDVLAPAGKRLRASDIPSYFGKAHWMRPQGDGVRPYRPLRDAYLAVAGELGGGRVWVYHLGNLTLQALNVALVFLLARRTLLLLPPRGWGALRRGRLAAFLAAALFAVHPMHMEAVAWTKNAAELLAATFGLASLLAFIAAAESGDSRRGWTWAVVCWWCYCLGLLVKESIVALPAAAVLWALLRRGSEAESREAAPVDWRRAAWLSLPLWAAGALYALGQRGVLAEGAGGFAARAAAYSFPERLWTAGETVAAYLRMLALPWDTQPLYALGEPRGGWLAAVAALCVGAGLLALLVASVRRRWRIAFGWWWTLLLFAPAANFFALNGERPLAEQRLYFPSVGWALLAAAAFSAVKRAQRSALAATILITLAGLALTLAAARDWRGNLDFWRQAHAKIPEARMAGYNLGVIYVGLKPPAEALAEAEFLRVLARHPGDARAAFELGKLYYKRCDFSRAADYFERATRIAPEYGPAHANLARSLLQLGLRRPAVGEFLAAAEAFSRGCDRDRARRTLAAAAEALPEDTALREALEALGND